MPAMNNGIFVGMRLIRGKSGFLLRTPALLELLLIISAICSPANFTPTYE